jgi:hypothetical protein
MNGMGNYGAASEFREARHDFREARQETNEGREHFAEAREQFAEARNDFAHGNIWGWDDARGRRASGARRRSS